MSNNRFIKYSDFHFCKIFFPNYIKRRAVFHFFFVRYKKISSPELTGEEKNQFLESLLNEINNTGNTNSVYKGKKRNPPCEYKTCVLNHNAYVSAVLETLGGL